MYFHPWLWYDGNQHGGMNYSQWASIILNRLNQPAPVTIYLDGEYSLSNNSGIIYATFKNDSTATINGRVIFVITEDSLFYPAPNGAIWHSNVPRDYIPDHNGVLISIPAGDSVTVTMPFTTHPNWNKSHCKIKTWIQNDVMLPDSTKEIWQGAMVNLLELGIKEQQGDQVILPEIKLFPNPCPRHGSVQFNFSETLNYEISIYNCAGEFINKISGNTKQSRWDLKDYRGLRLKAGVYFYRVVTRKFTQTGKIVIE